MAIELEKIHNISELANAIGCPIHRIGKALFKGTDCGICFAENELGIAVAGYAEGSDCDCPNHILEYPFTMADFWSIVALADLEGCELWEETQAYFEELEEMENKND